MQAWAKLCVTLLADGQRCYWVKFYSVRSSYYVFGSYPLAAFFPDDERFCIPLNALCYLDYPSQAGNLIWCAEPMEVPPLFQELLELGWLWKKLMQCALSYACSNTCAIKTCRTKGQPCACTLYERVCMCIQACQAIVQCPVTPVTRCMISLQAQVSSIKQRIVLVSVCFRPKTGKSN